MPLPPAPYSRKELDQALASIPGCQSIGIVCGDHPFAPLEAKYVVDGTLLLRCFKCEKMLLEVVLSVAPPPNVEMVAATHEATTATKQ